MDTSTNTSLVAVRRGEGSIDGAIRRHLEGKYPQFGEILSVSYQERSPIGDPVYAVVWSDK
jgi:hypothetical protein